MADAEDLTNAVRKVLLDKWDPNGVGDNEELADEYDPFIQDIVAAVRARVDSAALRQLLLSAEQDQESQASPEGREAAVQELMKLGRQLSGNR